MARLDDFYIAVGDESERGRVGELLSRIVSCVPSSSTGKKYIAVPVHSKEGCPISICLARDAYDQMVKQKDIQLDDEGNVIIEVEDRKFMFSAEGSK